MKTRMNIDRVLTNSLKAQYAEIQISTIWRFTWKAFNHLMYKFNSRENKFCLGCGYDKEWQISGLNSMNRKLTLLRYFFGVVKFRRFFLLTFLCLFFLCEVFVDIRLNSHTFTGLSLSRKELCISLTVYGIILFVWLKKKTRWVKIVQSSHYEQWAKLWILFFRIQTIIRSDWHSFAGYSL